MANIITIARVILLFVGIGFIYSHNIYGEILAFAIVIIVIIMDWIDGYVARKRGDTTPFGAVLDIMTPVPYGYGKRDIVIRYAQEQRSKLKDCFAYGDSIADVSMFSSVGNPSVVNPGSKLQTIAGEHGWGIEKW